MAEQERNGQNRRMEYPVRKEIEWRKFLRKDNLLVMILCGILLFIVAIPTRGSGAKEESQATSTGIAENRTTDLSGSALSDLTAKTYYGQGETDYAETLEKRLEESLSGMEGVGKVKVMITLRASEELVVEKDQPAVRSTTTEQDSQGGTRSVLQSDLSESTVYKSDGSSSEPYVIKTLKPQVEGVLVVAQGAGTGNVNKEITEIVQALFRVEAHKVKVVKMDAGR